MCSAKCGLAIISQIVASEQLRKKYLENPTMCRIHHDHRIPGTPFITRTPTALSSISVSLSKALRVPAPRRVRVSSNPRGQAQVVPSHGHFLKGRQASV